MLQTIVTQGWRRLAQAALGLGMATLLSACGGGGGSAGDPVLGGGGGSTPSGLTGISVTGNATLANSGTDTLALKVTALTSGNTALIGVETPISFAVDSGAVVTPAAKVTSTTDGTLAATVSLTDKTSRVVTVTVSSGGVSQAFKFNVVDSVSGSKVADISLVSDKTSLPNNGTQVITITATTVDAKGAAAGGAPLTFEIVDAVTGRAVVAAEGLATTTSTTNGQLKATVTLGSNLTSRTIAVNAISGTVTRSISFDVVESSAVTPTAADMTISLDKTTIGNGGSDEVAATVTAVDASRNAVKDIDVTFSVDSNAVLIVGNSKTAADGTAKATIKIGADKSNRVITVTAKSGTFTRQASFRVTGAKLQATLQPANLKAGETGQVQYTLTDVNTSPIVGAAISVAGPGAGASATGVTNGSGQYVYSYVASGSGAVPIAAQAGGTSVTSTVQIEAQLSDVPASTNIASATFTVAPSVVSVNTVGSSENLAELRLLFLGDNNQPIPNVRVRLGLGDNVAGTDGVLSSTKNGQDGVVTSDANGLAVASFIAGQRSSATDQIKVYACYGKNDSVASISACPTANKLSVSLTVVEQPVSVSIGTDKTIANNPSNSLTYIQQFTVLVVDQAGKPKSDVQLSPVLDLPVYGKGYWSYSAGVGWRQVVTAVCLNEDSAANGFRNGTIEVSNGASEDLNGNGQLDPRKSDVSIAMVGSTKTDSSGTAVLRIEYPKNYGSWVEFSIRVSASGVVSPPAVWGRVAKVGDTLSSLTGTSQVTGVPISAVQSEAEPPFSISPYGQAASCTSPN